MSEPIQSGETRKSSKTLFVVVFAVVTLAALGYVAVTKGWLPGFGKGHEVARELKADIESAKGDNIKSVFVNVMKANFMPELLPAEEQEAFNQDIAEMEKNMQYNLQYSELKTVTAAGKGGVEIIAPVLTYKDPTGNVIEQRAEKVVVYRSVDDRNHYYFQTPGKIEYFTELLGAKQKVAEMTTEQYDAEIKVDDASVIQSSKANIKNLQMVEGRGNTILFKIQQADLNYSSVPKGDKSETKVQAEIKTLELGDMAKLLLGPIEPISLKVDFDYNGSKISDFAKKMGEIEKSVLAKEADREKAEKEIAAQAPTLDADFKLSEFSIFMGQSGVKSDADLKFGESESKEMPKGDAKVSLVKYQEFLNFLSKSFGMPAAEVEKTVAFLKEIGTESNGNIDISFKFDGTENVLINGKTAKEVEAIQARYFPENGMQEITPSAGEIAPAPVTAAPLDAESHEGHAH